ncbi:MAG: hypothetical protein JXK93_12080, partial [Sphaerochaetaceae bacterium]|nr:hypothetical protein [Sphaerochaetaceae bacterium]
MELADQLHAIINEAAKSGPSDGISIASLMESMSSRGSTMQRPDSIVMLDWGEADPEYVPPP